MAAEPEVVIGSVDGPAEHQFADVVAVVRQTNGDIVVADGGAFELRSYDAGGTLPMARGQGGRGARRVPEPGLSGPHGR